MRSSIFFLASLALSLSAVACSGASDDTTPTEDDAAEADIKSGKTVAISASDDGKTVTVDEGQKIAVTLSSNASTGYSWMVKDDGGLGEAKQSSKPRDVSRPGAAGTQTFTWSTTGLTGSHDLELIYQRPWAELSPPAQTLNVTVVVRSKTANPGELGGMCGGFAGLGCNKGLVCKAPKTCCDMAGICVKP